VINDQPRPRISSRTVPWWARNTRQLNPQRKCGNRDRDPRAGDKTQGVASFTTNTSRRCQRPRPSALCQQMTKSARKGKSPYGSHKISPAVATPGKKTCRSGRHVFAFSKPRPPLVRAYGRLDELNSVPSAGCSFRGSWSPTPLRSRRALSFDVGKPLKSPPVPVTRGDGPAWPSITRRSIAFEDPTATTRQRPECCRSPDLKIFQSLPGGLQQASPPCTIPSRNGRFCRPRRARDVALLRLAATRNACQPTRFSGFVSLNRLIIRAFSFSPRRPQPNNTLERDLASCGNRRGRSVTTPA